MEWDKNPGFFYHPTKIMLKKIALRKSYYFFNTMHLFVTGRETVDKADGVKCCVVSSSCVWNSIYDQFYCNLLSCIKSHPICYNGEWEIRLKDMNSEILGFLEFLCQTTFSFEDGRHYLCQGMIDFRCC